MNDKPEMNERMNDIFARRDYDASQGEKALQRLAEQLEFLNARKMAGIDVEEVVEDGSEAS